MTPQEIKATLVQLGAKPNKGLGQNFLIDQGILQAVVAAAHVKSGDKILEIGPGLGVLTEALLEKGAAVVAIERDRRFAEYLVGAYSRTPWAHNHAPVRIIQGDATEVHWHEEIGQGAWKFVSNLPYSITSFALRKALWTPNPPEILVALVQREVAERACSVADKKSKQKTSLLSLMVAFASEEAQIVRRVPPGCFYPPPKVESAILRIKPLPWRERDKKWGIDPEKIMSLARRGFAHPRKLLRSNLSLQPDAYGLLPDPNARAEDLSPEEWAHLTQGL